MEYELITPQRWKMVRCMGCGKWDLVTLVWQQGEWGENSRGWLHLTCGHFARLGEERGAGGYRVLSEGH